MSSVYASVPCCVHIFVLQESACACRKAGGEPEQLTPGPESGLNARTRVHEYGGGESIIGNGVVYFSNFK